MNPFLCIAHRGASGTAPENTLRAICQALASGAHGVEIDVRLSREGAPVVIHDARLRRTTGTPGLVASMPLAMLRALDAGEGERLPTLREVLDTVPSQTLLNIELKARGTALATLEAVALKRRDTPGWTGGHLLISSFDRSELATVAAANAAAPAGERLRIGLLLARRPLGLARLVERFGAYSIHLPLRLTTRSFLARAAATGAQLLVYTVNDPGEIGRLQSLGVHGVFTDYPERALLATSPTLLAGNLLSPTPAHAALFHSDPRFP